jgi:hypothetical protein
MRLPISGCLLRRLALLHFFGCGTLPQGNNLPLLWLVRKLDRFDKRILRLRCNCGAFRGDEGFCRVHIFAFRFEGAALLSSPSPERAGPIRTKGTRQRPRRRAAEHEATECHETQTNGLREAHWGKVLSRGTRLRGATRSAGADGMNTTDCLIDECESAKGQIPQFNTNRD